MIIRFGDFFNGCNARTEFGRVVVSGEFVVAVDFIVFSSKVSIHCGLIHTSKKMSLGDDFIYGR